jgi:thioredoxin-like negative regulator of GroEL
MFAAARVMQGAGEFAQAAELYRRMIAMNEKEMGAKIGLGVCLLELGQEEQGLEMLRAVAGINAKLFGQAMTALTFCGRGRSWMRPSDAARFFKGKKP